jgi:hypothetical protein
MFQEELFDEYEEEDCPCLYCNELFSFSKPGESKLPCSEYKLWAQCVCVLELQKEPKSSSLTCENEKER